ncbi:MAG: adenylate kinase [Planctomycetota bacterium]
MKSVLILLGAPGSGKGTQAKRLAASASLPHVSTGDLFRENIADETELGRKAKDFMNRGELVPDGLVLDMLFDRVARADCEKGYILDGFPRTLPQAEALQSKLGPGVEPRALQLLVPDDVIVERASGRLLCKNCGNIHHKSFKPPKTEGVCDACGEAALYQREDDAPDVVRERLKVYVKQTAPLARFYEELGLLVNVNGDRTPDEVYRELESVVLNGANGGGR